MARALYVGNLPYDIGDRELQELFATAGSVESLNIIRDHVTGRARGFAFVELTTDAEGQNAIRTLHGYQFRGRGLIVNEAWLKSPMVGT
jgi:cold-inducible RNA-binding protein